MTLTEFAARVVVYGFLGIVMEVFFTGLHSVIFRKDRNATCRTSLWMVPLYGVGTTLLDMIRSQISYTPVFIPLAVLYIYAWEFSSGWALRKIGVRAWDYTHARFGVKGLIRLDYMPFWLVAAIGFDAMADYVSKALGMAGTLT